MLLTNGCSFVWGDELKGHDTSPPTQWEHTFTHILADYLEVPYKNLSNCGNGNDKIFRDTINYLTSSEPQPTNMVIVWSAWQRTELCESSADQKRFMKIHPHDNLTQFSPERIAQLHYTKWNGAYKWYNTVYNTRADITHGLTKMQAMRMICDGRGIKLIQAQFHERNLEVLAHNLNNAKRKDHVDWRTLTNFQISKLDKSMDRNGLTSVKESKTMHDISTELGDTKEFGHPGEETHREYAKILYNKFLNM